MNTYDESWFDNKTKEDVIKQIGVLRKNIKKKHRALKRELIETNEMIEKQLRPIADPLKKLIEESGLTEETIRPTENKLKRKLLSDNKHEESTPIKKHILNPAQGVKRKKKINLPINPDFHSGSDSDDGRNTEFQTAKRLATPVADEGMDAISGEDEEEEVMQTEQIQTPQHQSPEIYEASTSTGEDLLRTPEGRILAKHYINRTFKGKLAKEYFSKLISGHKEIDHNYGLRVEGNDWKIGDKKVDLDVYDIIINGKRYTGTRGLYELIFMSKPNEYVYDEEDLNNYGKILTQTNVHRVNYMAGGKLRSNRGGKYKTIISQIAKAPTMMETYSDQLLGNDGVSGSGLTLSNTQPNIVYYDDPNEIVDRLRTLIGSQQAGNTGHENEINAIIEELYELQPELCKQIVLDE